MTNPRFFSRAFRRRALARISIMLTEAVSSMWMGAVYKGAQAPVSLLHPAASSVPCLSRWLSTRASVHIIRCTSSILDISRPVSYTHLRAHETDSYLVCRLLLEKKKKKKKQKQKKL